MIDNSSIHLDDGRRKLSYAENGDPKGIPVIHCHGSGGSRLEHPPDDMLKEIGVRFISIDRPGHGLSDPAPGRTLLDFADDVATLARHLMLDKFYVEGWSAGGAYALACAYKLPDMVIAAAILSGIGPPDRPLPYHGCAGMIKVWMFMARNKSRLVYPFRRMMHSQIAGLKAEDLGKMIVPKGTEALDEIAVASSPSLQLTMGANIKEGYRQGYESAAEDDYIVNGPWGFDPKDINTRVDIWQGEVDKNVPLCQGEYQHECLPNSNLKILAQSAHLFPLVHWKEILLKLISKK